MKKFAKISLITAGVLAVLGCLFCLIGAIGGGRSAIIYAKEEQVLGGKVGRLTNKLLRLAGHMDEDLSLAVSENGEIRLTGEGGASEKLRINGEDPGRNAGEGHIDTGKVRSLHLMLGAGTFTVSEKTAGEGETIDLYIQGEGGCDYYVEKETLYVEGFKGIHTLGSNFDNNNITLKVPMGMRFDEVEVEVGAGVMELYDIEARELEASVGAGGVSMYRSEAGELSVEIGAGEFHAEDMTSLEADLSVGLGTCSYQGIISKELEAECNMGSMEFLLKGRESDFNYEIECSGGNIEMDSFETAAFAAEKYINNGAAGTFELNCNMGNISVHFEE